MAEAPLSAGAARGRAQGAMSFSAFGMAWAYAGLQNTGQINPGKLALPIVVCVALLIGAAILLLKAKTLPRHPIPPGFSGRAQRVFWIVNLLQWAAIVAASAILLKLHRPYDIAPAIAAVVGLHLFPLAGAFRYRPYLVTGALLMAWAVGCAAILPAARLPGLCSLGAAALLFAAATFAVVTGLRQIATPVEPTDKIG